jgi:hypothetical protein
MSTLTSRTKQTKPAGTDVVDVAVLNGDFDINDTEIGAPVVPISSPLPTVPYDGQLRYDKNDGFLKVYDAALLAWEPLAANNNVLLQGAGGAWKKITPTLTNITLGTGTTKNDLSYIRLPGNLVFAIWDCLLGTSGAVGGIARVDLPVDCPLDASAAISSYSLNDGLGWGECNLTGIASRHALLPFVVATAAPGQMAFIVSDSGANLTTGVPIAFAAGSQLSATILYRTSG